jgi:hypothetical protein
MQKHARKDTYDPMDRSTASISESSDEQRTKQSPIPLVRSSSRSEIVIVLALDFSARTAPRTDKPAAMLTTKYSS